MQMIDFNDNEYGWGIVAKRVVAIVRKLMLRRIIVGEAERL